MRMLVLLALLVPRALGAAESPCSVRASWAAHPETPAVVECHAPHPTPELITTARQEARRQSLPIVIHLDRPVTSRELAVLAPLVEMWGLNLPLENDAVDLTAITQAAGLARLQVGKLTALAPLAGFSKLERLRADTGTADLAPLAALGRLRSLSLWTRSTKLDALARATELVTLHVMGGGQALTLPPLGRLSSLRELWLSSLAVEGWERLAALETLEELDLEETNFRDLKLLAPLRNLHKLRLRKTAVQDLSPLLARPCLDVLRVDERLRSSAAVKALKKRCRDLEM